MSANLHLNLYLVTEGEVTPVDENTGWDALSSILVAAESESAALEAANAYDRGEVEVGNLAYGDKTIACVRA